MEVLLHKTNMLDYEHPSIQSLIQSKGWDKLDEFNKSRDIYNFVRDEILFGYNLDNWLINSSLWLYSMFNSIAYLTFKRPKQLIADRSCQ